MSPVGPSLPNGDVRFDGEFQGDSGLIVLAWSFVEIDRGGNRHFQMALAD
jgi:hypothetical protein